MHPANNLTHPASAEVTAALSDTALHSARVDAAPLKAVFHFTHRLELDGFRGLAVLVVMIGHLLEFRLPTWGPLFATFDKLGVLLFFVLSGFLITGLLHRERSITGHIAFRRFYLRRILRLAPALVLFLSAVMLMMKTGWITDVSRKEILECLFYVRNIFGRSLALGHIWSLSLEEQFYLLWPVTFMLLPLKKTASMVTWACIAIMIWRGAAISGGLFHYESGVYYMRPYFRFDSILIGAALVLSLASSARLFVAFKRLFSTIPPFFLWGALAVWTALGEQISRAAYLTLQEVLVAAVLAQLVVADHPLLNALFRSRPLCYLGAISYSLYLWQQLFLVTYTPSWGALRELPLSLLVPLLLAILSFHLLEKPILSWKERLAPQATLQTVSAEVPAGSI